ncbi:MAG: hypothetical protein K0S53_2904 [Bacteroidetes bacterium]|jgi:hypothetical protein|nr:hypothetical protein [Bacteroidota bacterium]
MRTIRTYIILLTSTVVLFNCKKYPEGGCERRGKKNLLNRPWKLTLYEVNGIDSTELINYNGSDTYKKISFFKNVSTISVQNWSHRDLGVSFVNENRSLEFRMDTSTIGIYCINEDNVNYCNRSYYFPEKNNLRTYEWEIRKLDAKELIIVSSLKNSYKIKLSSE